jgi:hypothetical protein
MAPDLVAITTFLHELFQHAPAEWPQRLDELCAAHPEHATELRRRYDLLRATGLDREVGAEPPAPELPDRLGEFRLLRQLGSGGMGMVFAAEQISLGREVALKVVRPEFLFSDAARERFRREIEAIARLEHPAIVPVLTHGEQRGVPYYVMPLVRGCPADEVVQRLQGRDPRALAGADLQRAIAGGGEGGSGETFAGTWWEVCVRLMRQVALGLHHAHSRGIVHRDVKPSNIMLTGDGRALLFDFGLAHVRDDARITRTGLAPGSPAYMSPEQVRGRASDERTDVYSLAATLHHLLSLTSPFPIQDTEVLRERILAGQAAPLQHRGVPAELQVVLRAAMDVDREHRHASALLLAEDLRAVLERRPIRARTLPFALRVRRWCGRHRAAAVGIAALLVLAAVLPGALWWQQRMANAALQEQTAQARRQADRAERNVARSLVVIDQMLLRAGDETLRNVPGAQAVAAELMQQAVDHFDRIAEEEIDASAFRPRHILAIQRLATTRMDLGDTAAAEALAVRSMQMLAEDGGDTADDHVRRAHAGVLVAGSQTAGGKLVEAMATLDRVERELQSVPHGHEAQADVRARCLSMRAGILEQTGDAAGARSGFAAALALYRDKVDGGSRAYRREAAAAAYNLSRLLRRDGETDAARGLLGEALAWLDGLAKDEGSWPTPAMVEAMVQAELGQVLKMMRDAEGSVAAFGAAIEQTERLVAMYPRLVHLRRQLGGTRCNLALLHNERREFARSRDLLVTAVADLEQALRDAPGDDQTARFLLNTRQSLCFTLRELGDFAALAPAAREFGRLPGDPAPPRGAARHLLRCAEQTDERTAEGLREEAIGLLLESERRGWGASKLDDPLYAPLQADPRFAALRARVEKKDR